MAVIARKQLTGSTQKIKEYAGHEGQLVFDKQTKHLHVLSGTAGKTTELANKSDIPTPQDISGKADKTYVDQQLATKADATAIPELVERITNATISIGGIKSNSGNAFEKDTSGALYTYKLRLANGSQEEFLAKGGQGYEILEGIIGGGDPPYIPREGARGYIGGFERLATLDQGTLNESSPDSSFCKETELYLITPENPLDSTFTKVILCPAVTTVNMYDYSWLNNTVPELKPPFILVVHWIQGNGLVHYIQAKHK